MRSHALVKQQKLAAIALLAAALPLMQPARAASQGIGTINFAGPVTAIAFHARTGQPTPQEVINSLSKAAFSMCKMEVGTVTRVDLISRHAPYANTTGVWRNVSTRWNCVATN